MSELTEKEREKEMERLCDELIEAIDNGPHPSPIPTPEQIRARNLHEIRRFIVEKKGLPSGSPYVIWLPDLGSNQGQTD